MIRARVCGRWVLVKDVDGNKNKFEDDGEPRLSGPLRPMMGIVAGAVWSMRRACITSACNGCWCQWTCPGGELMVGGNLNFTDR